MANKEDAIREIIRDRQRDYTHYITPKKYIFREDVLYFGAKIETCKLSECAESVIEPTYENEKDAIDAAKKKIVDDVIFGIVESGASIDDEFSGLNQFDFDVVDVESELNININKIEVIDKTTLCPRCSGDTQKTGTRTYVTGLHQMRRCIDCGYQYKGEKIVEPDLKAFAKEVKKIGDLALKLAGDNPLRAQQLLDMASFMHRRLYNKSDATATMEEFEEEAIREEKG